MPSARAHCKLRLPRPAQQRGIIQDVSSMFVLQVNFYTCIPYTDCPKNIPTIMVRITLPTMDCSTTNTQVTFHSVISIHFSWFFSTKQCFIAGPQRPSWLEWGWSPANHRPQSGPFDPPETMVRTNSSAARSFANACWCHDDIYKYAWIPYVEREWMRCICCNFIFIDFP